MILDIGFGVRSKRGTQFRIWANENLKQYILKGFVVDDDRLKNLGARPDYFDELLERIRDIRASEKRFYQKVRDFLVKITMNIFHNKKKFPNCTSFGKSIAQDEAVYFSC